MQKDYAEILFQSVDQIISERLKGISYDITDTVTIINTDYALNGKYEVSDGSATYYAYSSDTTYELDDVVYVTVPNGDYSQQKIIIGKYVADNDKPYVFQTPFQTIVDVTGNIITDKTISTTGLVANNPADVKMTLLWQKNFKEINQPLNGYTRLGLQAQFRSWLTELECAKGEYGLLLRITIANDITVDKKSRLAELQELFLKQSTAVEEQSDLYVYIKETLKIELSESFYKQSLEIQKSEIEQLYYNSIYKTYDLSLSTNDMYGDPFNYNSFYQQEQVFNIADLGTIIKGELYFYEKPGTFINKNNELLPYQDEFGNLLIPNLFVKDPYICLGYDIGEFDEESAVLFTNNTRTYTSKQSDAINEKTIQLRWFHEGKGYNVQPENITNYEIRWYRYAFGSPAADEYCGVYWKRVNEENKNSFLYSFIPNTKKENEQIKVIIIQGTDYIVSNIITFTNEQEVVNDATKDFLAGLNIWCTDGSYGNYYIYDPGNKILEQYRTTEAHKLVAMFSAEDALLEKNNTAALLTEAESITWTFNTTSTMIIVNNINYSYKYNENKIIAAPTNISSLSVDETGMIYTFKCTDNSIVIYDDNEKIISITRHGDKNNGYAIDAEQYYFIKESYAQSAQNNIVQCKIVKNGNEYFTSKRLGFGQAGTTGTDATLRIYFDPAYRHSLISKDGGDTLNVRAVLYDSQNQEIDLNDETDTKARVEWKWYAKSGTNVSIIPFTGTASDENNYNLKIGEVYYQSNARNEVILQSSSKISMDTFLILEVTIKGWGNFDLTVRRPVPISAEFFSYDSKVYKPTFIDCAEEVIYGTAGYVDYYKEAWRLHYNTDLNNNGSMDLLMPNDASGGFWELWTPDITTDTTAREKFVGTFDNNVLKPLAFYVENADKYGGQYFLNNEVIWSQPVYVCQNTYPSSTLSEWDGKSLTIDYDKGSILATSIAAGKKDGQNRFSGVLIGEWGNTNSSGDITKQTGVYGFHEGAMSYAFKEDGTAFIGKSGKGRLLFDGTHSTITSELYDQTFNRGMMLDFDDGLIKLRSSSGNIELNANPDSNSYPFKIGSKFWVTWDGTLTAVNGNFSGTITGSEIYIPNSYDPTFSVDSSGNITAKSGTIGGFTITSNSIYSNNNKGTYGGSEGIFLGSNGRFSLGDKFKFSGNTLFIASNIYRPSASSANAAYFLIGINNINESGNDRLQIGSAGTKADYDGVSIYGAGEGIYLVAVGSDISASGGAANKKVLQLRNDGVTLYGYTAEQQEGFYARFA